MVSRETCPLSPVASQESKTIGVIGAEPGAGASFVCSLLERELEAGRAGVQDGAAAKFRIIDLGEYEKEQERPALDKVIVVADGKTSSKDRLYRAIKIMNERDLLWAVVFNRCTERPFDENLDIPCFTVPFISKECITELYNFIFYS